MEMLARFLVVEISARRFGREIWRVGCEREDVKRCSVIPSAKLWRTQIDLVVEE